MTTLGTASRSRSPTGLRVAAKSYKQLEEVAEGIRPLLPTVAGDPFKIDAARVLEETLPRAGFQYYIEKNEVLKECAGFSWPEHQLVVLRQDVYDGLYEGNVFSRSTVIHELSHIVLDHATTLYRGAPVGRHRFFEDSEWQANSLTAAIMMPIEACDAADSIADLGSMCGTSMPASTYRIQRLVEHRILDGKRFTACLKRTRRANHAT